MDLGKIDSEGVDWFNLAHNRNQRATVVKSVMNFHVS
jgi:hypothetical protein